MGQASRTHREEKPEEVVSGPRAVAGVANASLDSACLLPREVLQLLVQTVWEPQTLCALSGVSRWLYHTSCADEVWSALFARRLCGVIWACKERHTSWKARFATAFAVVVNPQNDGVLDDVSREMAERGHDVRHVIFPPGTYSGGALRVASGVAVEGCGFGADLSYVCCFACCATATDPLFAFRSCFCDCVSMSILNGWVLRMRVDSIVRVYPCANRLIVYSLLISAVFLSFSFLCLMRDLMNCRSLAARCDCPPCHCTI